MSKKRFSEVADRILMYFPNQKIEAIKNLSSELGIGLKEAKDEIEAAMDRRATRGESIQEFSNTLVREKDFNKIEAIKTLRRNFNLSLTDGKNYIEAAMTIQNLDTVNYIEAAMTKKDEFILFVKMYDYSDPIEYKVSSKEEARNVIEVLKKSFSGNIYDVRLFQEVFNF